MESKGYIHQLESFGCADGPGSRFIIFFSGCPLRCLYCHNPDTWKMTDGKLYTVEELVNEAMSCKEYWGKKGGVTVSGGEPLFQIDFLQESHQHHMFLRLVPFHHPKLHFHYKKYLKW